MEIEYIRDPLQFDLENNLPMDHRHRVLPDGEFVRACNRATERDDLFVYHHLETGNFMLAAWVHRDSPRICTELEQLSAPPDRGGHLPLDFVRCRCLPLEVRYRQMVANKRERDYAVAKKKADNLEARSDVVKHLKKRGMHDAAAVTARSDYSTEKTEITEALVGAAKGKQYHDLGSKPKGP